MLDATIATIKPSETVCWGQWEWLIAGFIHITSQKRGNVQVVVSPTIHSRYFVFTILFLCHFSSAVSHLCYGSCKAVEYIGKGLCNVLDVAVEVLRVTESVCNWASKAINFILTQLFRVHRYINLVISFDGTNKRSTIIVMNNLHGNTELFPLRNHFSRRSFALLDYLQARPYSVETLARVSNIFDISRDQK